MNTTARLIKDMMKNKKLEMKKHPFIITTKSKPALRQLQIYKILPFKHPHKERIYRDLQTIVKIR